jgi:hypothetical protein
LNREIKKSNVTVYHAEINKIYLAVRMAGRTEIPKRL